MLRHSSSCNRDQTPPSPHSSGAGSQSHLPRLHSLLAPKRPVLWVPLPSLSKSFSSPSPQPQRGHLFSCQGTSISEPPRDGGLWERLTLPPILDLRGPCVYISPRRRARPGAASVRASARAAAEGWFCVTAAASLGNSEVFLQASGGQRPGSEEPLIVSSPGAGSGERALGGERFPLKHMALRASQ